MDINKRGRSELKNYFKKDALPTEQNFAELIEAMLNQKDDGVVRLPGAPLSIQAAEDAAGARKVLSLYAALADSAPAWTLSLRGLADPDDPATGRDGLSVMDGGGATRLFLDRATGNAGVGTVAPAARLHVAGDVRIDGDLTVNGTLSVQSARCEDWKPLSLSAGWDMVGGEYSFPEYCKDAMGLVHLRGVIKGANAAKNQPCATLPAGYRPLFRTLHTILSDDHMDRIDVTPGGDLVMVLSAASACVSLHGIVFQAGA